MIAYISCIHGMFIFVHARESLSLSCANRYVYGALDLFNGLATVLYFLLSLFSFFFYRNDRSFWRRDDGQRWSDASDLVKRRIFFIDLTSSRPFQTRKNVEYSLFRRQIPLFARNEFPRALDITRIPLAAFSIAPRANSNGRCVYEREEHHQGSHPLIRVRSRFREIRDMRATKRNDRDGRTLSSRRVKPFASLGDLEKNTLAYH